MAAGIAMVHQESLLAPHLTVAENVFLGREERLPFGWANRGRIIGRAGSAATPDACFGKGAPPPAALPRKRRRPASPWFTRNRCWRRIQRSRRTSSWGARSGFRSAG